MVFLRFIDQKGRMAYGGSAFMAFIRAIAIFCMDGLYSNMEHGKIDVHEINYYSPTQVVAFMEAIEAKKPMYYALIRNSLEMRYSIMESTS